MASLAKTLTTAIFFMITCSHSVNIDSDTEHMRKAVNADVENTGEVLRDLSGEIENDEDDTALDRIEAEMNSQTAWWGGRRRCDSSWCLNVCRCAKDHCPSCRNACHGGSSYDNCAEEMASAWVRGNNCAAAGRHSNHNQRVGAAKRAMDRCRHWFCDHCNDFFIQNVTEEPDNLDEALAGKRSC